MEYFLKEERRTELQAQLAELTMPEYMTSLFSDSPNDIEIVDQLMKAQIETATHFADEVAKAALEGDPMIETYTKFVMASIAIMRAHLDEAVERDMTKGAFKAWTKACLDSLGKLQAIKDRMTAERDELETRH